MIEEIQALNAIRNVEILRAVDRINQDYDRQIAVLFSEPPKYKMQLEPVPFGMAPVDGGPD